MREICSDPEMPGRASVHRWLIEGAADNGHPDCKSFRDQYEEAFVLNGQNRAEKMLVEVKKTLPDGAHVSKTRLLIDTEKWLLARSHPRYFGDRVQQDLNVTSTVDAKVTFTLADDGCAVPGSDTKKKAWAERNPD